MKRFFLFIILISGLAFLISGFGFGKEYINKSTTQGTEQSQSVQKNKDEQVATEIPKGIPVLMYHKIGPDKDNDAVIREDLFKEQMKFLKDHGYHTLTMQQLYDYVKDGKPVPVKPVVLTFDDGYADTYSIAYPTLKEYGFVATVYLNPGDMGTRLTWEQAKEMNENGLEIASHGFMHKEMAEMTNAEQKDNIVKAQQAFQEKMSFSPKWFCYPYSSYNAYTLKAMKEEGLLMATTMKSGWVHQGDDLYQIKRIWIGNAVDLKHFEERITTEHYSNL